MTFKVQGKPCDLDHNGECLICDSWLSQCSWDHLHKGDFEFESLNELLVMFKDYLTDAQKAELINRFGASDGKSKG